MTTDIYIQKPKKVSIAINLLIASTILGFINSIMNDMITETKNYSSVLGLITIILTLTIEIFFICQINKGKKWARTTSLVLSILGALLFPFIIINIFKSSPIVGILSIVLTILQIISLILIYSKEGNEWFSSHK